VPETPGFEEGLERIDYRIRDVLSYVLRNSASRLADGADGLPRLVQRATENSARSILDWFHIVRRESLRR
jgi:hypothetical protein